jgi:hypothetical protein
MMDGVRVGGGLDAVVYEERVAKNMSKGEKKMN